MFDLEVGYAKFNDVMRDDKRQVILLLDNASCHRVDTELSNVKVHFLPPTLQHTCSLKTLASSMP